MRPSLDDDVDLDGQAGGRRRIDAIEHAGHRKVDVVHRAEDLVVERIEADRHARQAGGGERLRLPRQERAVGRQRQVDVSERCQLLDEHRQIAPDERLAARDADLLDAAADEDARDALDLLERQQLVAAQELVVASEDLLRHAVDAPEVAPVGDGDAEVPEWTAKRVGQGHGARVPRRLRAGGRC